MKLIYESVDGVPGGADEVAASFGECGGAVGVEAEDDFVTVGETVLPSISEMVLKHTATFGVDFLP